MQRVNNPQVFAITRLVTGQQQLSVSLARINNDDAIRKITAASSTRSPSSDQDGLS